MPEQLRIKRVDEIVQRVVARNAPIVGKESAQEVEVLVAHSSISTKSSALAIVADRSKITFSGSG